MTDIVVKVDEGGDYSNLEDEPPTKLLKIDEIESIRPDFHDFLADFGATTLSGSPESHESDFSEGNLFPTLGDPFFDRSVNGPIEDLNLCSPASVLRTVASPKLSRDETGCPPSYDQNWNHAHLDTYLPMLSTPSSYCNDEVAASPWHDGLSVCSDPAMRVGQMADVQMVTQSMDEEQMLAMPAVPPYEVSGGYLHSIQTPAVALQDGVNGSIPGSNSLLGFDGPIGNVVDVSSEASLGFPTGYSGGESENVILLPPPPQAVGAICKASVEKTILDHYKNERHSRPSLAVRNQLDRARPGRLRDSSPSGFGQDTGSVTKQSNRKRAYQRSKFYPEWYHWAGGHLLVSTKSNGERYLKKRLTKHDIKCLTDVVGFTIGLEDETEAPPVLLPLLKGYLPVVRQSGRGSGQVWFVQAPQEPFECLTKEHVYALELQHGFCREYALKESAVYQELHSKHYKKKMPQIRPMPLSEKGDQPATVKERTVHYRAVPARAKFKTQVSDIHGRQPAAIPAKAHGQSSEPDIDIEGEMSSNFADFPTSVEQERLIQFLKGEEGYDVESDI